MISESQSTQNLHKNESIKSGSNFLRGTILEGLSDLTTGDISADDTQLTKFHGIYQQDDRDVRSERRKQKLDKAYSFMARVGIPGGVCNSAQWIVMDDLSRDYSNGTLKLTTRQAFQLHGIIKSNLKHTIRTINDALMTTLCACGDVNRNVMCNPNPHLSSVHADAQALATALSKHLMPATRAYHEIWLDEVKVAESGGEEVEPIYGKTYLPRKFKIAVAVPPSNDVDVFAHCLGFIAVVEDGKIVGYNVSVGGGLGMTHGNEATFPRLADVIAFCTPDQAVDVAEKIVTIQRDHGDRSNRAHARFKYTVEDKGAVWIREELERRLGYQLQDPRKFEFESNGDRYGWQQGQDGNWHLNLFIEGGRLLDRPDLPLKTGLRKVAEIHTGEFRLTANQNLIIANITPEQKPAIEALVSEYKLNTGDHVSGLRRNSIACVSLPTCGLALAESERYLPKLIDELETVIEEAGLRNDDIIIRSTGCPNGCGRPYLGEIGLVGKVPGKYNLYLGAGFAGERLNKLYRTSAKDSELVGLLTPIIRHYAKNRKDGERFGDFVIREGYVQATNAGNEFHHNTAG
jgi:sulfite reductase (NADPH) hemoprotein beta-component